MIWVAAIGCILGYLLIGGIISAVTFYIFNEEPDDFAFICVVLWPMVLLMESLFGIVFGSMKLGNIIVHTIVYWVKGE